MIVKRMLDRAGAQCTVVDNGAAAVHGRVVQVDSIKPRVESACGFSA